MTISRFLTRRFFLVAAIAGSFTLNAGCDTPLKTGQKMPTPVTENGLTLVWGQDVKTAAIALIRDSRRYCYLDMYELSDTDILSALYAAKKRGLDVRVVVDATESHSQTVAIPTLTGYRVPIYALSIKSGIDHVKMLATDQGTLIGGMNFGAGSWNNNDASVYIPQANSSFTSLFRWDIARAQGQPTAEPAAMLPLVYDHSIENRVVEAIHHATKTVEMEAFDLSDYAVTDALVAACRRGVAVEILLDPGQYANRKSADELQTAGATVRFYQPYEGEWMHAKILDVDHGRYFLIGSANFSHQAYTYNHEADIFLTNMPDFAHALESNLFTQISRGTDYPSQHF